jgi:hypothetical protein
MLCFKNNAWDKSMILSFRNGTKHESTFSNPVISDGYARVANPMRKRNGCCFYAERVQPFPALDELTPGRNAGAPFLPPFFGRAKNGVPPKAKKAMPFLMVPNLGNSNRLAEARNKNLFKKTKF